MLPVKKLAKSTQKGLPIATPFTWGCGFPWSWWTARISGSVPRFSSGKLSGVMSSHLYTRSSMCWMVLSTRSLVKRLSTSREAMMWLSAGGAVVNNSKKILGWRQGVLRQYIWREYFIKFLGKCVSSCWNLGDNWAERVRGLGCLHGVISVSWGKFSCQPRNLMKYSHIIFQRILFFESTHIAYNSTAVKKQLQHLQVLPTQKRKTRARPTPTPKPEGASQLKIKPPPTQRITKQKATDHMPQRTDQSWPVERRETTKKKLIHAHKREYTQQKVH